MSNKKKVLGVVHMEFTPDVGHPMWPAHGIYESEMLCKQHEMERRFKYPGTANLIDIPEQGLQTKQDEDEEDEDSDVEKKRSPKQKNWVQRLPLYVFIPSMVLITLGIGFAVFGIVLGALRIDPPSGQWAVFYNHGADRAEPSLFTLYNVRKGRYLQARGSFNCPVESAEENMSGTIPVDVVVNARAWDSFSLLNFKKKGESFAQSIAAYACYRFVYDTGVRTTSNVTVSNFVGLASQSFKFRNQPVYWRANDLPITGLDGTVQFGTYVPIGGTNEGPVVPVGTEPNWKVAKQLFCHHFESTLGLDFCSTAAGTVDHPVPGKTVVDIVFL